MRVLIIEDEQKTAADLKATLMEMDPGIQVLDILDSVEGSIRYLKTEPSPDLIYMDIQLADGLSFEIFGEVQISCPVVFCTAFDEYAIEAFKVNGVDYILKPFDKEAVGRSLAKVKNLENFFQSKSNQAEQLSQLLKTLKPASKGSFLVSFKDKMIPISTADVAFFNIEHELTFLYTFSNQRYNLPYTLDELSGQLDDTQFYRANRQYLVNYKAIREVEHYFSRKLLIKLSVSVKEPIIVSKAKAPDFLRWMDGR